jgi:hypothetical protein
MRKKVSRENVAMFFFACKKPVSGRHRLGMFSALSVFNGDLVFMNGESRPVMKRVQACVDDEKFSCWFSVA